MPIAEIRHDTASLARFVETLSTFCRSCGAAPSYIQGSSELFAYLEKLADCTLGFLQTFPDSPEFQTSDYEVQRQKLRSVRDGWSSIHLRLKAASDADTLHVPATLFDALRDRLHELLKYEKTELAVFHIERVNFLHLGSDSLRKTANDVANLVGCTHFPPTLSLIGIPYSQSDALFVNCIVAHELGHFIYSAEPGLDDFVKTTTAAALRKVFSNEAERVSSDDSEKYTDLVELWWEELFCDLIAVRLVGPAFTHAFIEIRDVVNYIDHRGVFGMDRGRLALDFGRTHPSHMFRIKQQGTLLAKLGWWKEIKNGKSHYITLIDNAMQLKDDIFSATEFEFGSYFVKAFLSMVDELHSKVEEAIGELSTGVDDFKKYRQRVTDSLLNCTVPTTFEADGKRHPSMVVIINAAYDVYLNSLDKLLNRIDKQNPSVIQDRAYWSRQLEAWANKAIEDLRV